MNRLLTSIMLLLSCFIARGAEKADYAQVIPQPNSINMQKGAPFLLQNSTVITYTAGEDMQRNAAFLSQWINEMTHIKPAVDAAKGKALMPGVLWCAAGQLPAFSMAVKRLESRSQC